MSGKRIVVTGGAGFIGSHLCERLINDGNKVTCLDNFFTGRQENIVHLTDNSSFSVINHDIVKPIYIEADQIFNLACPASPVHYQFDPIKTIQTNVIGCNHMLDLAKQTKATILQASTSEVYGDPKVHPQIESYWGNVNPVGIRSCYDEGKRCAETLFFDYHRQYGVDIRVVRIFNTYGPKMLENDGRVISNFIVQALRGEDITVYGSGQQTRSFCYVSDLVDALVKMMNSGFSGPVNLGNPVEMTIEQIANLIISMTKSLSKLVYKPLPMDDPTKRKPDISIAKEKLSWQPAVSIEEGLAKTIQYFKERFGRNSAV